MKPRIALYTFGIFARPSADPVNDGFHARNDANLAAAEASAGFIARSGYDGDPGPASWGKQVYPRFYTGTDAHSPSTLSLWSDLESPFAFTYHGLHAEALSHGRDWFAKPILPPTLHRAAKPAWPPYVLWWVAQDHVPDWREGVERLEYLHDHGPSLRGFDWKTSFDANGAPYSINRENVRHKTEMNRAEANRRP